MSLAEIGSILPVVNVVVFLQGALRPLDQLWYAGPQVVAHQRLLLVLGVVILKHSLQSF